MTTRPTPARNWPDSLQAAEKDAVVRQLAAFWRTLAELPDLIARNERLLAADLLHGLRSIVLDLVLALNGIRRPAGTRCLNAYLSASQRHALERTLGAPSAAGESWVAQAVALTVIYRWYAPQLVERYELAYPQALEDEVWAALRAGLYDWPLRITSEDSPDKSPQGDAYNGSTSTAG